MEWLIAVLLILGAPRSLGERLRLACEKQGFVDVRDFGACRGGNDEKAIRAAEEFAKTCIPGRVLPVHYCPAKPSALLLSPAKAEEG